MEAQEISISVSTHPLFPKNTVATNFVNLQLTSSISHSFVDRCESSFITGATSFNILFYERRCLEKTTSDIYRSTCEIANNVITYNLTFLLPVRTTVNFEVNCNLGRFFSGPNNITLFVTGKKTLTKQNLFIVKTTGCTIFCFA